MGTKILVWLCSPFALISGVVGSINLWLGIATDLILCNFFNEINFGGYTPQEWGSMYTAFLFCRFVCHDKMLDICEPGRYTNWREHAYGIGYRRF